MKIPPQLWESPKGVDKATVDNLSAMSDADFFTWVRSQIPSIKNLSQAVLCAVMERID